MIQRDQWSLSIRRSAAIQPFSAVADQKQRAKPLGYCAAALLGLALLLPAQHGAGAQTPARPQSAPVAPERSSPVAQEKQPAADVTVRSVSLRELGHANGVSFSGLRGYRDMFFPAPRQGLQGATLRVKLRSGAAFQAQRHLQISVGGSVLLSRAITGEQGEALTVPVDPRLAQDGFFRVTLRYSGALQADRCIDERVAGDFVEILPDTTLEMRLAPAAFTELRTVASLLPREVTLVLPPRELQRSEITSAVRLAAFLKRRGSVLTIAPPKSMPPATPGIWSRGVVLIGQATDFPDEIGAAQSAGEGLSVVPTGSGPALLMSGESAASALSVLNSPFRELADHATLAVNKFTDREEGGSALTFEALGLTEQNGELDERVQFEVAFSSDSLPQGSALDGVKLELAVGTAPSDANADASIFAFLNGRLLGSRRSSGAVPTVLAFSVPEGLVGRDNTLTVRFQRQPRIGACANPGPGQPVQLLPSSRLEFSSADVNARQFHDLPQLFRGGVDIVLPAEMSRLREALSHLLSISADLLPADAPITVRKEGRPAVGDKPFIIVSRSEPDATSPRLRFDQGAFTLNRSDGKTLIEFSNGDQAPTIAQVLHSSKVSGLWLRPGNTMPEPDTPAARLDRGDVAVIDRAGIALAFATEQKENVTIVYHDIRSWADLAAEYRPLVIGALWIALTVLFVGALSRMYRRRRSE